MDVYIDILDILLVINVFEWLIEILFEWWLLLFELWFCINNDIYCE